MLNLYLFTVATPFYLPTEKVISDANGLSAAEYSYGLWPDLANFCHLLVLIK